MAHDTQQFSFFNQVSDGVARSTEFFLLGKMIQALENHLHRNVVKRAMHGFGDAIGHRSPRSFRKSPMKE
jgi:hypothetical protein